MIDSSIDLINLDIALVRSLDTAGCERLAADIRSFLIKSISRTGGHLGANLGVVEVSIALHRVFRSPDEPIIFDVGHQAYTHKILTGRASGFATFRQRHGMSGFPEKAESPHDLVENSHSSMGPAWALGYAIARVTRSVVVIGDGALTGGVAFEGLNAIGVRRLPVVIVYNDNGRSYARTQTRLTLGEPCDDDSRNAVGDPSTEMFFRALGYTYIGPTDGHDLGKLESALKDAAAIDGPVVVHVRTQKGYGWSDAEHDEVMRLHQVGGTIQATTQPAEPLPVDTKSWGEALGASLCELAEADSRVHVITAAMPDSLGLLEFQRRFPDRFHDVGICEPLAVGLAAGLAGQGCRPVFAVFATFLSRAFDQIVNDVALHDLPVTFVLDRAGVSGGDGATSHGTHDLGMLRMVPGLEVYAPSGIGQLSATLGSAVARTSGPIAIRYGKWRPLLLDAHATTADAVVRRRGADLCLLAHGSTVQTAMAAAEALESAHGLTTTVWEVVRLHPAPERVFDDAARHRAVLAVEDVMVGTGLHPDLLTHLERRSGARPMTGQVALPQAFLPWGPREELLAEFGVSVDAVLERAVELLG